MVTMVRMVTTTRVGLALSLGLLGAVALGAGPHAQERRVASPAGHAATQVGGLYDARSGFVNGAWIEVHYGRPLKRGRDIFGEDDYREFLNDGAPVWRAGANATTRLITEVPLVFGATTVAAGEYTVFIDLAATPWAFVVSNWRAQVGYDAENRDALYGAFEFTADKDVVRVPMSVEPLPHAFEQLSWQFLDVIESGGTLALFWDTTVASVPFTLAE